MSEKIRSVVPSTYGEFPQEPREDEERRVEPHDCERCGHHMKYADQQCACSSRPGR